MEDIIKKIKLYMSNNTDIVLRKLNTETDEIYVIYDEVLCNGKYINEKLVDRLTYAIMLGYKVDDLYNILPSSSIKVINTYDEVLHLIFQGFTIFISKSIIIAIETREKLDRGILTSENEPSLIGPNDSFTENFNTNLGLIRKRIRSKNLYCKSLFIGKESNTKVGICYMNNICDNNLVKSIYNKIKNIDIDAIIDTGYIREILLDNESLFPTVIVTERPDYSSMALLEGKIVIIVDSSPFVIILPAFFIDFFHTPDDYYQKSFNTTFIRIIRLLSFFLSIFLPSYYISVTTLNPESIPLKLLISFYSQRLTVPFPGYIEAIIMIICFEILREGDARTPSKVGTSISILGGLVLGSAAVEAGIVSPIMIIVIATSMISGLLFSTNSLIYPIRYFRIITLLLSAFFGLFGMFIGLLFLIVKLCSIHTFGMSYVSPFSPIIKTELRDSIIKIKGKNKRLRNPLLSKKNITRGTINEK